MSSALLFAFIIVWLGVLTTVFFLQTRFLRNFIKEEDEKDLIKVLKRVLAQSEKNAGDIAYIRKEISKQNEEGLKHVQKVGIVRFNPFRETGGDHSFSLAILNGKGNGFIITGLHTRERTRIYLKEIKDSGSDIELSKEEKMAFDKAQKSV